MYARRRRLPTKPAAPAWKWGVAVLSAVLLLMGGGWLAAGSPRNPAAQPAATARTMEQDWATLKGFGPRPVGTPGHGGAAAWLETQFTALGYRVTRQPVTLERPFDGGGTVRVGKLSVPAAALYGAGGGEQSGRLVRVSPTNSRQQMEAADLRGQIALVALDAGSCGAVSWRGLADRTTSAGAFGLVVVDGCPRQQSSRVTTMPLPLVRVNAADGQKVLKLAGQTATVTSNVEVRKVTGHNLIAARVEAAPEIVFGAHLDSVNASSAFARDPSYPIRETRAMLNMDMVGVAAEPLGFAGNAEVLALARQLRPDLRVFRDDDQPRRITFGRTSNIRGSSDHVSFIRWGVRTGYLYRGEDANYHGPGDKILDPDLVRDTADFALKLAKRVLEAPWTPRETCGITGRDCRE